MVAFDLAGGEAGRPAGAHRAAFDLALEGLPGHHGPRRRGRGGGVHRGGAAPLPRATGSATAPGCIEDPRLRDYVRDRRIPLEINITSNVQTRAVARAAEHPVRAYFDAGVAVTLCTDGWLMCGVSLTDEYWLAHTAARLHPRGDRPA